MSKFRYLHPRVNRSDSTGAAGQSAAPDHVYPRDYTDRQLMEAVYRRIDGLAAMLSGPIEAARRAVEVPPTERPDHDR